MSYEVPTAVNIKINLLGSGAIHVKFTQNGKYSIIKLHGITP